MDVKDVPSHKVIIEDKDDKKNDMKKIDLSKVTINGIDGKEATIDVANGLHL